MEEIKRPFFLNKRILKKEMLNSLRDYPRDVMEIYTETMSDGILWGFSPTVDKNIITFSKGVIKYKGDIFVLNKNVPIEYRETEVEVLIKLNFHELVKDNDYETQYVDITIDKDINLLENQKELGRFKLKKGAFLRSDYQDLYDFVTEYNTINIVNVLYAGYKENTMSSMVFKYFATEALKVRTQNQMDINICMMALNSSRIEREMINHYISYRLDEEYKVLKNIEIHKKLVLILNKIKKESSGFRRAGRETNKIILD